MKTARFFIFAIAILVGISASAQELSRSYTDIFGNQIYEYCDRYGRISRTDTVEIDVLGNTVVTVRDAHNRIVETITYETDILGATIITIRDAYGVIVERIKYSTDALGRTVTTITDRTGRTVRYKNSHYCRAESIYVGYVNIHINLRNNKKAHKPQHNIHNSRPRQDLQRPPQHPNNQMQRPNNNEYRPNNNGNRPQNGQRPPQYNGNKPNNNQPHGGQRPPQFEGHKPGGKPQGVPYKGEISHKKPTPKEQGEKNFNKKSPR